MDTMFGKLLLSIVLKMVSSDALEDLLIWALENLARATNTKIDDELVEIVKKYLGRHDADPGAVG